MTPTNITMTDEKPTSKKPKAMLRMIAKAIADTASREAAQECVPVEILSGPVSAVGAEQLCQSINSNHETVMQSADAAKTHGKNAVRHAIIAGLQLVSLKQETPHGQWEWYFTSAGKRLGNPNANHGWHLDFTSETARKYIALATQVVSQKLQPEQSAALMALASGAEAEAADWELLDEITPAKSLRATYLEFGIVKPTAKESAWLERDGQEAPDSPRNRSLKNLKSAKEQARMEWFGTLHGRHVWRTSKSSYHDRHRHIATPATP